MVKCVCQVHVCVKVCVCTTRFVVCAQKAELSSHAEEELVREQHMQRLDERDHEARVSSVFVAHGDEIVGQGAEFGFLRTHNKTSCTHARNRHRMVGGSCVWVCECVVCVGVWLLV